jgi:hypothetical protein
LTGAGLAWPLVGVFHAPLAALVNWAVPFAIYVALVRAFGRRSCLEMGIPAYLVSVIVAMVLLAAGHSPPAR